MTIAMRSLLVPLLLALVPALTGSTEPASDWTCVPEGNKCTFDSDCCSKNCVNDPKLGKVCKAPKSG